MSETLFKEVCCTLGGQVNGISMGRAVCHGLWHHSRQR